MNTHVWFLVGSFDFYVTPQKIIDCPHSTDSDFENLRKGYFFFCTKEYWPYFWKFLKKVFLICLFWNFCILKRDKYCVLEVCIKHVTCFKCTNMYFTSTFKHTFLEHLDKCMHAFGFILPFVIIFKKKNPFPDRPTQFLKFICGQSNYCFISLISVIKILFSMPLNLAKKCQIVMM